MFHWQDLRYALRRLVRAPWFTLLTVVVLAGGLGLSIFTFSFLHTAMLKPLPLPEGEGLVRLLTAVGGRTSGGMDAADFAAMRGSITTLRDLGVYDERELVVGSGEGTRAIGATSSEWNIFEVTRTPPVMGRGFTVEDQLPGAEPVVVLSHATWRAVFGADPKVVNSVVRLSGVATRVIGVMPPGYGFPVATDAWTPIRPELVRALEPDKERVLAYGRLVPGRTVEEANAELTALLLRVRAGRPPADSRLAPPDGMKVLSFPLAQIGDEAPLALGVLNLLATLILILACINVTTLLLARANERARETAVRLALGAPRGRLIMQSLWEVIVLCLLGGALATGLASWLLSAVNTWARTRLEGNLAFWWVWGFDRSVLVAAGGFVTLAVMVLGAIASRRAVSARITEVLKDGAAQAGGRREGRVTRFLVASQVGTVSLLLFFGVMAGLVTWRIMNADLGFDTRNLLSAQLVPPEERYPDQAARGRFYQALYDGLSERGEVDGVVLRTTLADIGWSTGDFELAGAAPEGLRPRTNVVAALGALTPLGIGLLEGRFFDSRDVAASEPVALVSRAMAARFWPGRSPIGEQLRLTGLGSEEPMRTVVGVVDDVLFGAPFRRDRSKVAAYLPLQQADAGVVAVEFRHRGSEAAARGAFHETLGLIDPLIVPSHVQDFDEMLAKMTMMARSVAQLFGAAFGFALLLAVSGSYGLMAWSIGRRTREIGVRRALGAGDRNILVLLLGQGARQLGIGALVALPFMLLVAVGFSRTFAVSLGVSVVAAVLVSAGVIGIVLLATWVPTRRAVRVEVREALFRDI